MANRHYHVGVNTVGYMPEGDVYTFSSKRAAVEGAKRIRDEILEDGYGPMLPEGRCVCDHHRSEHSRSRGRCSAPGCVCHRFVNVGVTSRGSDGDYYIGDSDYGHLDAHVWVSECESEDCEDESNEY